MALIKIIICILVVVGIETSLDRYNKKTKYNNPVVELVVAIIEYALVIIIWAVLK